MASPIEPPSGAARLAYFTPVREYPPLADRKASVLLAAYGLMVTVLFTFAGPAEAILVGPRRWAAILLATVLVPLSLLILSGAWYAFRALTRPIPPMPDSLAFYPHIAALAPDQYREASEGTRPGPGRRLDAPLQLQPGDPERRQISPRRAFDRLRPVDVRALDAPAGADPPAPNLVGDAVRPISRLAATEPSGRGASPTIEPRRGRCASHFPTGCNGPIGTRSVPYDRTS